MTGRSEADVEEIPVKVARVHRSLTLLRGAATSRDGELTIEVFIDGRITKMVVSQWFSRASPEPPPRDIDDNRGDHRKSIYDRW